MATLAFKALSYGADRIPDKLFEAIPGGYFKRKEEKELKRRKREKKIRSQSEGRGRRRRSPSYSDEDDDYYSSDYYTSGDEFEREHRRRRKERNSEESDERGHRGRERERRRSHHERMRSYERYADEDVPPDFDPRSHSEGAERYRAHFMPPPLPPYGHPQPPFSAADGVYAQPQPHNPAPYTQAKPYNPAEYGHGQLNLPPMHATPNGSQSTSPMTHSANPSGHSISAQGQTLPGKTVTPPNATPQSQTQSTPTSMQQVRRSSPATRNSVANGDQNAGGYYGTSFPPPPPGSRSSRASSVDSRGMHQPYIPHSNLHTIPAGTATAGVPGSPYKSNNPPGSTPQFYQHNPAYMPQSSSPYLPNYNPYQPPSQPVSRHDSIHSGSNNAPDYHGSAHGGHGSHSRTKNEGRRRHSIAVNTDPRFRSPYHPANSRTAATSAACSRQGSRTGSRTGSINGSHRNSISERIHEVTGFDGARDFDAHHRTAAAGTVGAIAGGLLGEAIAPGTNVGTVMGAAAGGLGGSELFRRKYHGRTYGGHSRGDSGVKKARREKGRSHSASVEDVTDEHFL
ncbi:hypothetical protein HDK77DRAFT_425790 [Phyllosticta capitalensis]